MNTPNWSDIFTADELAAALDVHAARVAKSHGEYSFSADLSHAASCIRDLADRLDQAESSALKIQAVADEARRRTESIIETLEKL